MAATWTSRIGVPNGDGSPSPAMLPPWRPTALGGTSSDSEIDAPTVDDGADGLPAYGYHCVIAGIKVAGGTSATVQLWAWYDWLGAWSKLGAPVTVLAGAAANIQLSQVGADRLAASATFTGDVTDCTVQFGAFSWYLT